MAAHRWKSVKQVLKERVLSAPGHEFPLHYNHHKYEAQRKALKSLAKEGVVKLRFDFPKSDSIYYKAAK